MILLQNGWWFKIRKRILVADDNLAFTLAIQNIMQNDCVDVSCTQFVEKALEIFAENEYCLVIISIQPTISRDMSMLRIDRKSVV